ncbi:TPA: hypothetical protein HA249_02450 [Candidatus Woesearchaeota archaeon]|nr:hypothetical protein [Candidatus Woesearchaeota archaeon]HIH46687.1 hypothetical protein [Candidatus Woesearchaeota archaeon]HII88396.1 hypothetical protein [Candidatus Woesearchaeota archaeon]
MEQQPELARASMSSLKIIEEVPVTLVHLKEDLQRIKKRDEELNFRANKTEEYLNTFSTMKPSDAEELFSKLKELGLPRVRDDHLVKLIDLLPLNVEELKTVMSAYSVTISTDNAKKIVDLVVEYAKRS